MDGYRRTLVERLEQQRGVRSAAAGPLYNGQRDEQYHPIAIDYAEGAERLPFVRNSIGTASKWSCQPYPQMLYWMAMSFFAPVPPESCPRQFFSMAGCGRLSVMSSRRRRSRFDSFRACR